MTTMAAVAVLVLGVFGTSQAASAAVPPSQSAQSSSTSSPPTTDAPIAIPMVAVPHASTTTGAKPNIVIPGSCGTAFLYPSNGGNHVHYDFGFEYLNNGPFYVNAHVGATNEDNGEAAVNSFSEASFSSSWEKQGNLYTGTGENEVSAYIYVFGFLYDCVSSPNLHQAVYVY
ncbi:hypothetical protein [Specibacter cremeus]|uniref:hypothetical protein n=1 Tax=Specibacter cremeus TaxID=1629051 RepID=UPI00197BB1A6|nr:hypothetical protein [Specibacter cremeus]